jgi:hypothetical protein
MTSDPVESSILLSQPETKGGARNACGVNRKVRSRQYSGLAMTSKSEKPCQTDTPLEVNIFLDSVTLVG